MPWLCIRFIGIDGAKDPSFRGGGGVVGPVRGAGRGEFREEATQGRRGGEVSGWFLRGGGRALPGQGAGEGTGIQDGAAQEPKDGGFVRLALPLDGHGEPVLL